MTVDTFLTDASTSTAIEWLFTNAVALFALVVAIVSLSVSALQNRRAGRLAREHLKPELKFDFDRPPDKNPVFAIWNSGYIGAESVTATYTLYIYVKSTMEIAGVSKMGYMFGPGSLYRQSLMPSEHEILELAGVKPSPDQIAMYEFEIRYFRPSDMRQYDETHYFFDEGGKYVPHSEFRKSPHYSHLLALAAKVELQVPESKNPGHLREYYDTHGKSGTRN